MQRRAELFETPKDILFSLKEISYTPETPRMNEPFTVRGKVGLFGFPFYAPIWVIATVTYPEKWWEEIIPIWGSPEIREMSMVVGSDFEITFKKGFEREGEFGLAVRAYAGPTVPLDTITLPPFPPVATEETTFTVSGEVPPEEVAFRLERPTIMPATTVEPGTDITISCPVTSECTEEQDIRVKCIVYEGSILPGHGTKLKEFTSGVTAIAPGETKAFDFSRRTVEGTIDRRDVEVEVWIDGTLVKESEWDDVYYVGQPPEEVIDFDLTKPTVSPAEIRPGTAITITCPIISACTKEQTATVKCIVYEGSILPGHGDLIRTYTSPPFTISPNQSYDVIISHTAVAGTIDRRDVEVEVYIAGKLVKENEWDDVYYVTLVVPPPTSDIRNFDFRAQAGTYDLGDNVPYDAPYEYKGKAQSGWLTISLGTGVYPSFFTKHTFTRRRVSFDEAMDWTPGRLTGSFTLPTTLEAGQTYNVRAKLETDDGKQETDTDWGVIKITGIELELLEVKIDPSGAGYVTVTPEPESGSEHNWYFPHGTTVYVTAHPNPGYVFESWSGEMTDTAAITAPVYPMTEKRTITAHFEPEVVPPPKADIKDFDFRAQAGTYAIGDRVSFNAPYKYKGMRQSGRLVLELGTGIYPTFSRVVSYSPMPVEFYEAMDWESRSLEGTFLLTDALEPGRTYSVRAKLETLTDYTQETDTDWGVLTIETAPPVGVSFQISIWGIPDFGLYDYWACYYWDPDINDFVGKGEWYRSYNRIPFSNVAPGGYLAVFLKRNTLVSQQYNSPTFVAVDGGVYQYDIPLGRVTKIG